MNENEREAIVGRAAMALIARQQQDPYYAQNQAAIAAHVAADPQLQQRVERMMIADPVAATEFAVTHFQNYGQAQASQPAPPPARRPGFESHPMGSGTTYLPMGGPIPHDHPVPTRIDGSPRGGYPRATPERRPVFQGNLPDNGQTYQGPPPEMDEGGHPVVRDVRDGVSPFMPQLPNYQGGAPPSNLSHPLWGTPDSVQQARERYERTGSRIDAERYGHARLRGVISDEHLNS